MFCNRTDAGQQLAKALDHYRTEQPLVLGLPRGGVVVGAEIARTLGGDLDVLLVKKLRAPDNPELAIGALCEAGPPWLNELVRLTGAEKRYLQREIEERRREMNVQARRYRAVKPLVPPNGRAVILVDDGLATGATMIAAVHAVSMSQPRKIIVAAPVGPPETVATLRSMPEVAGVVCLHTPSWFSGVGQFYDDFTQVEDEEVVDILRKFV
ncbi:MAG: phosphoribosyltransferase family protein [Verrucomicrobiae bacterium]|nr:phosphoribosyltransferase family protein [Verrucomicrobiae bacterium]